MAVGFPRHRQGGLPVPFVAERYPARTLQGWNLAALHEARANSCVTGMLCQVCGVACKTSMNVFTESIQEGAEALDGGPLHLRCARLALATCPNLRRRATLHTWQVTAHSLEVLATRASHGPLGTTVTRTYLVSSPRELISLTGRAA